MWWVQRINGYIATLNLCCFDANSKMLQNTHFRCYFWRLKFPSVQSFTLFPCLLIMAIIIIIFNIYHHLSPYCTFTRLGLVVFSLFPRIKCTIKLYFGHKLCICIWGSRRGRDALASLLCYCQWPASPFGNARIFGHFSVKFGQSLVTFLWIFVFLLSTHSLLLCLAKAPIEQRKDLIWNRFKDPPFNWSPGQLVPSRDLTVENDLPLHLSCISGDFVPHTLVSRQDRCAPQSKSH